MTRVEAEFRSKGDTQCAVQEVAGLMRSIESNIEANVEERRSPGASDSIVVSSVHCKDRTKWRRPGFQLGKSV